VAPVAFFCRSTTSDKAPAGPDAEEDTEVAHQMTETHAESQPIPSPAPAPAPSTGPSRRRSSLDLWLNIGLVVLLLGVLGLAGYFAYNVYVDRIAQDQTTAAGRITAALARQVRTDPNNAVLRVRLAEALGAQEKYPQAIEQLNAALKIEPKHAGAYLDLGQIAIFTKQYEAAKAYFQKVVDITDASGYQNLDPAREQALYNLGILALNENQYDQAAGYFKASLRIRGDASDTYYQLAKALKGIGEIDGAIQNLEMAITFDPGFAEAHYFLGELYKIKKDDVNASYQFVQASKLAPTADQPRQAVEAFGPASKWLADARTKSAAGDLEGALTAVLIARNLDDKNFDAALLHAQILEKRSDPKSALSVYREALKLQPNNAAVKAKISELEKIVAATTAQTTAATVKKKRAKKKVVATKK
jgi:tetratricopeptide (TPR) repeat protein